MTSKVFEKIEKSISLKPGIYIVSTPIGNLKDITLRALEVLSSVDLIACEDTRVSKKLLSHYGISKPLVNVFEHNEDIKSGKIIDEVKSGKAVALISDAGTPLISDPGFKLIREAKSQDIYITALPGATSTITALTLSGFPTNSFIFSGFIPVKEGDKVEFLSANKDIKSTQIFFETANRLLKTLKTIGQIYPNRNIAVIREITKMFEEAKTGTSEELIKHYTDNTLKGEIVVLVEPSNCEKTCDENEIDNIINEYLTPKSSKDLSELISQRTGVSKKIVYDKIIKKKTN